MDQLKQVLAVLKKYHFWILCVVILVAFIGTWFMATGTMVELARTQESKIKTAFDAGDTIRRAANHPNPDSLQMMKMLTAAEAEQVRRAWEIRYREQEDVLVWPSELKQDMIQVVEKLKPIELTVEYPIVKELKLDYRNRYRDYIMEEMPKLAEIIGSKWVATPRAGGSGGMSSYGGGYGGESSYGMGMGGGEGESDYGSEGDYGYGGGGYGMGQSTRKAEEDPIIVAWSAQNQAQLQASSFNWVQPNTLQLLYAQEDLWVLRSLLMTIKATNGDVDAQYNASIKEILTINLGRSARGIKSVGSVSSGASNAMSSFGGGEDYGGEGYGGEGYGDDYGDGEDSGGGEGESGYGGAAAIATADPADNRYVDDQMEPLTGDRLRTAMRATTVNEEDAFLVVAKRMPVRLRVKMNVLKLPLFLSELSNANLPIEVRQIRINAKATSAGGYGGGGMAPGGMAPGGMGTMGGGDDYGEGEGEGYGGGYGGSGGGLTGTAALASIDSPYDSEVEIYGLIYIYNPVDVSKLEPESEEDTAAAATGEPGDTTIPAADADATGGADAPASDTAAGGTAAPETTTTTPPAGTTPADGTGTADGSTPAAGGTPPDAGGGPAGGGAADGGPTADSGAGG